MTPPRIKPTPAQQFAATNRLLIRYQVADGDSSVAFGLLRQVHAGLLRRGPITVPSPTSDDLTASLTVLHAAREQAIEIVDRAELAVINALRDDGMTWHDIGEALGAEPDSARQAAMHRHRRLTVVYGTRRQ